jgi:predicted nucleic acid-binding protein
MSDVVVASCVVAKWVLPEPDSNLAVALFHDVTGRGERLLVLDVAIVEAANAVWKQEHRGLIDAAEANHLIEELLAFSLHVRRANRLLPAAMEIAVEYDRSVYDALFVALCDDLGLPGVTADEPLWRAVHADFPNIVLLRDWR